MESWRGDEYEIYNSDMMNLDYFLGDPYQENCKEMKTVVGNNEEDDDIYTAPLACPSMDDFYDFYVDHKTAEDDIMNLDVNHLFDQDKICCNIKKRSAISNYKGKGKEIKTVVRVLKHDTGPVVKAQVPDLQVTEKKEYDQRRVIVDETVCPPAAQVKRLKIIFKKEISVIIGQNHDSVQKNKSEKVSSIDNKDCNMTPQVAKRPMPVNKYRDEGKEFKTVLGARKTDIEAVSKAEADLKKEYGQQGVIVRDTACPPPPVAKARPRFKIPVKKQTVEEVAKRAMPVNKREFELKTEATRKKLRDSYEQANNHKRRKAIQLIDFQQLPPMPTNQKPREKPMPKPKVSSSSRSKFFQGSTGRKRH